MQKCKVRLLRRPVHGHDEAGRLGSAVKARDVGRDSIYRYTLLR